MISGFTRTPSRATSHAASVIARETFLRELKNMEEKYKVEFPKGASAAVQESAVALVKGNAPSILLETAKCHFKTTDAVLKKAGTDRSTLGPEGQVVSKAKSYRHE